MKCRLSLAAAAFLTLLLSTQAQEQGKVAPHPPLLPFEATYLTFSSTSLLFFCPAMSCFIQVSIKISHYERNNVCFWFNFLINVYFLPNMTVRFLRYENFAQKMM